MKFAHLSDVHIGGWREPKMREVNLQSFSLAVERILQENVDFVLIAGDLFNTAVPAIESLRHAVDGLKKIRDAGISIYVIPGSHDFSPSGKTIIDVLESAGLVVNVSKPVEKNGKMALPFVVDKKTGAKIAGLQGKKGQLDIEDFARIDKTALENEPGTKIFMFHTTIKELRPAEMDIIEALPASALPQGFDYYAGGHIHVVRRESVPGYKNMVYPGPVFPNNFAELEKLRHGSFVLWKDGEIEHVPLPVKQAISVRIEAQGKTPAVVEQLVRAALEPKEVKDAIVTIRVAGTLSTGKPGDVQWNELLTWLYNREAYFVMKNTNALDAPELDQAAAAAMQTIQQGSIEEIEEKMINDIAGKSEVFSKDEEKRLAKALLQVLAAEKGDGEKVADFEMRLQSEVDKLLNVVEEQ